MKNGSQVADFERAFAEYVDAKYAIALCNGTATLHTALVALGVKPGDRVAVPPLTMSATTMAVLHAGATPIFCDVDPNTWLMGAPPGRIGGAWASCSAYLPVSLYGLHHPYNGVAAIDDAAQTLRKHGGSSFTSYSFQASKILALGEGGMLVTDDEELATKAREFSSLGYRMRADQPRIDPAVLKSPTFDRHHSLGYNYRMNDLTAAEGLRKMREYDVRPELGGESVARAIGLRMPRMAVGDSINVLLNDTDAIAWRLSQRRQAAGLYHNATSGCSWITPQHVPSGWKHDYWCYAVALESAELWHPFVESIVRHGGERPYAAWKLTYHEPAFRHLVTGVRLNDEFLNMFGLCPVAESLQPRLVQFQTNDLISAQRNAEAVTKAIREIGG